MELHEFCENAKDSEEVVNKPMITNRVALILIKVFYE